MRWLGVVAVGICLACTRANPEFGEDGNDDGGGTTATTGVSSTSSTSKASASSTTHQDSTTTTSTTTVADTGPADTGIDPTTTGVADTGIADTGTVLGDCCSITNAPGCTDVALEDCVCNHDGTCCEAKWSEVCTDHAQLCGGCDAVGDCCAPHNFPGCQNLSVEQCVCEQMGMPGCCNEGWGSECVGAAIECQACVEVGECCVANPTPGCGNPEVAQCVCQLSPHCCVEAWTQDCADQAGQCGATDCG